MSDFFCDVCRKPFNTKSGLSQHKNRKVPCKPAVIEPVSVPIDAVLVSDSSFRERSDRMNKEIGLLDRQAQGIFFTPKKARDLLFDKIAQYKFKPTRILEPSFGSGEFLEDALLRYPNASVSGVELNEKLYKCFSSDRAKLIHGDFLQFTDSEKFDFIIGNPPYFVFDKAVKKDYKAKKGGGDGGCDVDAILSKCCLGRANIYVAFLYKCLTEHLVAGGFLGFVLPTSLFNCSYYEPMRRYIATHCTICFVKKLDVDYYETSQDTMLIIIQNKRGVRSEALYTFKYQDRVYISPYYKQLQRAVLGTQTLDKLGFLVKTGDVVWNNEGEYLRESKTEGASLLIYTNNVVDGKLVIDNLAVSKKCCHNGCERKDAGFGIAKKENEKKAAKERWCIEHKSATMVDFRKKQYIAGYRSQPIKAPAILVSRGFGNASAEYAFIYALVSEGEFYAENHINVIIPQTPEAVARIPMIMNSLGDGRTKDFIKYFNANGAMSKSELEQVLPIYC